MDNVYFALKFPCVSFGNDRNFIQNLEFKDPLGHSDHCVLIFEFLCYVKPNITRSVKFNYLKADFVNLRKEMDIDWKKLLSELNTNDMVNIFMEQLTAAMNNHIPTKKCSNKPRKTPLSEETRCIIREKHRAWEKYRKCKDNDSYRKYTRARNKAKSTITRERKQREKEIAESAKTNYKNFWSYINSKRKARSGISELHSKVDNKTHIANTDQEKAEVLAKFFTSMFTKETDDDKILLDNEVDSDSSDNEFKPEEILKLLKELNTSKSPGPDQVHPKVLHELFDVY